MLIPAPCPNTDLPDLDCFPILEHEQAQVAWLDWRGIEPVGAGALNWAPLKPDWFALAGAIDPSAPKGWWPDLWPRGPWKSHLAFVSPHAGVPSWRLSRQWHPRLGSEREGWALRGRSSETQALWEDNRQEGQGSPNRGNSLQASDIFCLSLKQQEETNKCQIFSPLSIQN